MNMKKKTEHAKPKAGHEKQSNKRKRDPTEKSTQFIKKIDLLFSKLKFSFNIEKDLMY